MTNVPDENLLNAIFPDPARPWPEKNRTVAGVPCYIFARDERDMQRPQTIIEALLDGRYEVEEIQNADTIKPYVTVLIGDEFWSVDVMAVDRRDFPACPTDEVLRLTTDITHSYIPLLPTMAIQQRITEMRTTGQRGWKAGRLEEQRRRESEMLAEAERDPEGAMGGRGNNFVYGQVRRRNNER